MDNNKPILVNQLEQFAAYTVTSEGSDGDDVASTHPLSNGQRALWVSQNVAPESTLYNISVVGHIRSQVNVAALRAAIQKLTNRHTSLRSTFKLVDGEPVQIEYAYRKLCFTQVDASVWNDDQLNEAIDAAHHQSFDLLNGPILHATLFTRSASEHVLLLAAHHLVIDGWAGAQCLSEIRALYEAEISGVSQALPPL
ncbi:MAG TPA: condensation domain-containing protein, partial [Anaerolineae bacterium]